MFKYFLKKLLRDKTFLFWTFIFPLVLMTCFKMAFGNIYNLENSFDPVKAVYIDETDVDARELIYGIIEDNHLDMILEEEGVTEFIDLFAAGDYEGLKKLGEEGSFDDDKLKEIENAITEMIDAGFEFKISEENYGKLNDWAYSYIFEMALESMAEGDDRLFELVNADSVNEGEKLLEDGAATVIFVARDGNVRAELAENYGSVEVNIINGFIGTFNTEYKVMKELMFSENALLSSLTDLNMESKELLKVKPDAFSAEPNPYNWYYNATIVMGIMFNILTGIGIVNDTQADVSVGALRLSVASEKKSKILLSAFAARLLVTVCISLTQLLIMNKVFGVPVGNRVPQLILFVVVANIFALSVGQFCGLYFKGKITERENKANALLMISVFLSGEMMADLPGIIQLHCPVINQINPATILCFSFYKLVYYGNLTGFYMELLKIGIAAVVFFTISVARMRRQRYASV